MRGRGEIGGRENGKERRKVRGDRGGGRGRAGQGRAWSVC